MPVTSSAQQIPAIVQWFQLYGNIAFFFAQLAWWIVTGFAAGWAACLFYRWVKYNTKGPGAIQWVEEIDVPEDEDADTKVSKTDKGDSKKDSAKSGDKVDVDKFVE